MNTLTLMDYLVMVVTVAVSWGMYYAAQPPPPDADDEPVSPQLHAAGLVPLAWSAGPEAAQKPQTPLDVTLKRICIASGYSDISVFLKGARLAYEAVLDAFGAGDIAPQAYLLSDSVREAFEAAIAERTERGETMELLFVGLRACEITDAVLGNGRASIDVRFVGQIVSSTRNREGKVVAGDPTRVAEVAELWTFERELRAQDPRWTLTGTDADE